MTTNAICQDLLKLSSITKVDIEIIFPQGAHFYQNINVFVYKQYINFLYKLNCFAVDQKCCSCPLSKECRYYRCTGENFKYYPNILIKNNLFAKSIFQNEESTKLSFFIIGNSRDHINYIKLFFHSYLNQKIAGNFYYLKNINIKTINQEYKTINQAVISSCIKTTNFISDLNKMINYYNNHYVTNYKILEDCDIEIKNVKHSQLESINFKTKRIIPKGYTFQIYFKSKIDIPVDFIEIGVGIYNFVGGGTIEV